MTGATLFSGIHSAELAMDWVDWKWCADIEEFPSAVGKYRHPHIPNLGDVTHADFIDRAKQYGPVELLVFGSPCQSFSVAGRRLGLDDPRGNLALHALVIVARLRPRWWLFENVPGLLSSGSGADFAAFLGEVEKLGYSCAWRVLDAQFHGVPQRRRRLFVVGCAGDWRASAAVLFERESVSRRHSSRRAKGTRPTNPANASARLRSFWEQLVAAFDEGEESAAARGAGTVCEPLAPTLPGRSKGSGQLGSDFEYDGGVVGHYAAQAHRANCSDLAYTLRNPGKVAAANKTTRAEAETALPAIEEGSAVVRGGNETQLSYGHRSAFAVRRLTAIEAARLQGFPDLWAHIPWQRRRIDAAQSRYYSSHGVKVWQEGSQWWTDAPCDGPLYRAFGNAMAVPVMSWLGQRIREVDRLMEGGC